MAIDKTAKYKRKIFSTSNKYQKIIILLTFFPSLLIFLSFIIIVFIGDPIMAKAAFHSSYMNLELLVHQFACWIIVLMCLSWVVSFIGSFIITHNIFGAFDRIFHELDEIIAGRSQKAIKCRPHDELTNELLKRVNVLVEGYVKNKNAK